MPARNLERILLVEDDPDIQAVARMALEKVGRFEVRVCSSGPEALEAFESYDPQMVILDVMMPEMDGPATLRALRELPRGERVPVVFMTAKVQAHEVDAWRALGALDVIRKPFDPMTLAGRVQELWTRSAQAA